MDNLDAIETQEPVDDADAVPAEGADNAAESSFLSLDGVNFKTPEDAVKSFKEQQRKITEMASTAKMLEQEKRLLEVEREQLRQQKATPKREDDLVDWQKRRDALQKRIDEEGGPAILEALEDFSLGLRDSFEQRVKEVTEQMQKQMLDLDPDYRSARDEVDALQKEYNLSRQDAIKLQRKLSAAKAPDNPSRPTPPGTMRSSRTTAPADQEDRYTKMLAAEIGDLSEKEQELLKKKYARRG